MAEFITCWPCPQALQRTDSGQEQNFTLVSAHHLMGAYFLITESDKCMHLLTGKPKVDLKDAYLTAYKYLQFRKCCSGLRVWCHGVAASSGDTWLVPSGITTRTNSPLEPTIIILHKLCRFHLLSKQQAELEAKYSATSTVELLLINLSRLGFDCKILLIVHQVNSQPANTQPSVAVANTKGPGESL